MTASDDDLKRALTEAGFACIETHISRVYLRGDDVYKTKRAVRYAFVDFSTAAVRRAACEAEVSLNRRLAPDVYRGVVAIVLGPDAPRFVPAAEVADPEAVWAVHMRYLDPAGRADTLLAEGALGPAEITGIAQALCAFHATCRTDADTARFGGEEVLAGNIEENFRELAPYFASYLPEADAERLRAGQRSQLVRKRGLLRRRTRDGRVRDGHGDLRLEHLYRCADGRFIAIDCIEFNDRFRYGDVALDLAFLAMDLHLQARPDLAELLLASYARESSDYGLFGLVDLYVSYRATVRAKVSAFLAGDASVSERARADARGRAEASFALALATLTPRTEARRLVVCCGLMASGKSTLARRLGEALHAPVVSADRIRKHLLHSDPLTPHHDAPFRGSYSEEITEQVYGALREHAHTLLGVGRSVILDATYRDRGERAAIVSLAAELGVDLVFFECRVPRDVTMRRLEERARDKSESDGRPEIFDAVARMYQPLDELAPGAHLVLDTSLPIAQNLARCAARLHHAEPGPA